MINIKKLLFGTNTSRKIKKYWKVVSSINALEESYKNFGQDDCQNKAKELRERVASGEHLNSILPEAFALVRRAAENVLDQRHFDVQLLGGMAIHDGQIAEMKTGEGKTLTATLPVFLNALTGKGVHLVTVNDYLAKRDAEWMGQVYKYLGLTVGLLQHGISDDERRVQYAADVTYGTNSEFGFDYLRDNMKFSKDRLVHREFYFAIVDEVDSILIDEARTPLIISGSGEGSTDKYYFINKSILGLSRGYRVGDNPDRKKAAEALGVDIEKVEEVLKEKKDTELILDGDYVLDEKSKNIQLTEEGSKKLEERLEAHLSSDNLYDPVNIEILHHVNQSLKAWYIFKKDVDYVVKDGKVIIVDEFTGRLMDGRRFSDGLHQALEAKENLEVENENLTLATITYQNYFRKYEKLAGMTGTAETEESEFLKIYGLGVFVVPTNRPMVRQDLADAVYRSKNGKNKAILAKIEELYATGQPVLVGTDSIEYSEELHLLLKKKNIPHQVLNAKFFEHEAQIISDAGQYKSVTIATNMAGRGTDIKLSPESIKLGGLYILGTVRHESRRVDNQLRGRSGRQGDPGTSKFFISLEDNLLRVFGGESIIKVMDRLKFSEDDVIEHVLISRAIENAQKKVEAQNFSIRKHLLEYDDVMNKQREVIYSMRRDILEGNIENMMLDMTLEASSDILSKYCPDNDRNDWDLSSLISEMELNWGGEVIVPEDIKDLTSLISFIENMLKEKYEQKRVEFGPLADEVEKRVMLEMLDNLWKDHLISMDILKDSIGFSGYAQKNPLDEYKKEAFTSFSNFVSHLKLQCSSFFFRVQLKTQEISPEPEREIKNIRMNDGVSAPASPIKRKTVVNRGVSLGRNDPCFCGSGKKYKHCHMGKH